MPHFWKRWYHITEKSVGTRTIIIKKKKNKQTQDIISSTSFLQFQGQTVNIYHTHGEQNKRREMPQWQSREKHIKNEFQQIRVLHRIIES